MIFSWKKNVSFMISQKEYHGREFPGSPGPVLHCRGPMELRFCKPRSADNQVRPKKERKNHGQKKQKRESERKNL